MKLRHYKDDGIDIRECGFIYLSGDQKTETGIRCVTGKSVSKEPLPVTVYTAHNVFAGYGSEPVVAMVRPYNETLRKRFVDENADTTESIEAVSANELEVIHILDMTLIHSMNYLLFHAIGNQDEYIPDEQKIIDLHANDDNLLKTSYLQYPFIYRYVVKEMDPDMSLDLDAKISKSMREELMKSNESALKLNGGIML